MLKVELAMNFFRVCSECVQSVFRVCCIGGVHKTEREVEY